VVSPLSTLERVWADEVFRHFPDMSYGVVHGTAERRVQVARDKYDIYIVNHDGLKIKRLMEVFQSQRRYRALEGPALTDQRQRQGGHQTD